MESTFAGICLGLTGGDRACRVAVTGSGLEAWSGGERLGALRWSSLEISVVGVGDKYLRFASSDPLDPLALLVPDRAIARAIEGAGAPRMLLEKLERVTARAGRRALARAGIWLGFLGAVVLLLFLGWALLSWAVDRAVELVPVDWEVELGRAAASSILEEHKVCTDPELERAMQMLGTRLMRGVGGAPYRFRVRVLDDEAVNAFALPGGFVFVNRGLIEESGGPFEVAGVLAHELQHVLGRHGIENVAHRAGLMIALSALVGDVGGVEEVLLYNAAGLASMSYGRDQERAADAGGLEIMYKAGLDVTGLPRFLQKLSAKEGAVTDALSLLSTHPLSSERVERLQKMIADRGPAPVEPLDVDWHSLRGRCSPVSISDPQAL